jgi:G:T-mismatch repair DNA endonuclease (very short patch repair protein)
VAALEALGWRVVIIWECKTRDFASLSQSLAVLVGRASRP